MTKKLRCNKLGKVDENYKHEPRNILYSGLINHPSLVLKMYSMFKEAITQGNVDEARTFMQDRIDSGEIEPLLGMGFAILSEDMLNVARWDAKYPIVLRNEIYGYEQSHKDFKYFSEATLLDPREVGSFCAWELGIVNHEKKAWLKYLVSQRKESDKERYLEDLIIGRFSPIGNLIKF